MNTLQELIDNGIDIYTAQSMLDNYLSKVGTMNGIYLITDIAYDFNAKGRDITLKCTGCGREIHRMMIKGRNKWSELIKSCPCQKEEKLKQHIADSEKISKNKKATIISRVGNTYGDYEIVSVEDLEGKPKYTMRCKECGAEKVISADEKIFNRRKDFHCTKHYEQIVKYDDSYIGQKRNFLEVVGFGRKENNHRALICKCDCGNMVALEPTHWDRGIVKSCGCFAKSFMLEHSEELDRLRRIYNGMMQRCYNKNCNSYDNYGGRGIEICQEWLNDRENFINWALSNGYGNDLSIDRIEVNGNYEPQNCRWATDEVQLENRRPREQWKKPKRRKLKTCTIDGETKPLREWYIIFNTSSPAVRYRMKTIGMSLEEALKTPRFTNGRPRKEG